MSASGVGHKFKFVDTPPASRTLKSCYYDVNVNNTYKSWYVANIPIWPFVKSETLRYQETPVLMIRSAASRKVVQGPIL